MIVVQNLIFDYPDKRALHDVSLRVNDGTITALVGPNGAGKTTLMRCIAGLEAPIAGVVTVNAIPVHEQPRLVHRFIGYLPDFLGVYEDLTVRQCLSYFAEANGVAISSIPDAVDRVVHELQLDAYREKKAGELSRGLKQRLGIAQAIIHDPKVLLLDEPASGLDPEARHHLSLLFCDLQKRGMTLLVSSHILAELDEYSTDVIVLRDGKILEQYSLQDGADEGKSRSLRIRCVRPEQELEQLLHSFSFVNAESVALSDDRLVCRFSLSGKDTEQQKLIRLLLDNGVSVCEFSEEKRNLQAEYIKTVERHP